ncbi:MAG: YggS family pyridoxal phosphate-dependent enzyme, partial [Phycisphaerae bacterium]|nr:YggS family pyridoxal phosphate-dependent enzyme [Phycisphaerae bacterium]
MTKIAERIKRVEGIIAETCARVGREPQDIRLVIVTKSAEFEQIQEVIQLGYNHLGENRVQQLKKVAAQVQEYIEQSPAEANLPTEIHWHMIGHLQRNKVRQILASVSLVHSVDTLRLAEEINNSAAKLGFCPRVLLQVNTSNEPQKYGVPVGAATHLAEQIETLPHLKLVGLMTMAPLTRNKDVVRACFAR